MIEVKDRNWYWGPLGVIRHEIGRSLTFWRVCVWFALTCFPVGLLWLAASRMRFDLRGQDEVEVTFGFATMMYILLPQLVTALGLLLWATPIVNSELEGQSWVYAVVRPGARRSVLLGKYVVAVLWTCSATCLSTVLLYPVMGTLVSSFNLRVCATIILLNVLASITYASAFVLIGTVVQRRAMATGFVFAVIVEGLISLIPAVANQFTIAYRLRSLFIQIIDLPLSSTDQIRPFFDMKTPIWLQLFGLAAYIAIALGIALWRVQASQFIWQSEA